MLMYWKTMFDRCYCINSTIYLLKFGKLYGTIFCHLLGYQRFEMNFVGILVNFLVPENLRYQLFEITGVEM